VFWIAKNEKFLLAEFLLADKKINPAWVAGYLYRYEVKAASQRLHRVGNP
jgi:hypothetical protein